jgi:hypothetical protein
LYFDELLKSGFFECLLVVHVTLKLETAVVGAGNQQPILLSGEVFDQVTEELSSEAHTNTAENEPMIT